MNKELPAGYQYFGLGPLLVLPKQFSVDDGGDEVMRLKYSFGDFSWVRGDGSSSSIEYALKIGSSLHKINFAARLLNQIENVSHCPAKKGFVCVGKGNGNGFHYTFNLAIPEVWAGGEAGDQRVWQNDWSGRVSHRHYYITTSKYQELLGIAGEFVSTQGTTSRQEYYDQEALTALKNGKKVYNSTNKEVFLIKPCAKYFSKPEPEKEEIKIGDIVLFRKFTCLCLVLKGEGGSFLLIELNTGASHPMPLTFIQENYIKVSTLEKEFPKGFLKK